MAVYCKSDDAKKNVSNSRRFFRAATKAALYFDPYMQCVPGPAGDGTGFPSVKEVFQPQIQSWLPS